MSSIGNPRSLQVTLQSSNIFKHRLKRCHKPCTHCLTMVVRNEHRESDNGLDTTCLPTYHDQ